MTIGIILGAAVWANGASPTLRRRTLCGARLYHAGRIDHLVLCGGLGIHPPTEAQAMLGILRTENVPDSAMTLEERSTTTGENLRHAFDLTNIRDAIIITDWYHAPRAKMVARRVGFSATSASPPIKGAKVWPQTKAALREIPAYAAYLTGLRR